MSRHVVQTWPGLRSEVGNADKEISLRPDVGGLGVERCGTPAVAWGIGRTAFTQVPEFRSWSAARAKLERETGPSVSSTNDRVEFIYRWT